MYGNTSWACVSGGTLQDLGTLGTDVTPPPHRHWEDPPGFPQTHSLGDEISTLTSYRGTDAGPVAITASARKILNILFGWARSGRAFDPARVFVCQSQIARAA